MFTGIIEEKGTIRTLTATAADARVEIEADTVLADAKQGDSIAVNGVCLTVTDLTGDSFFADVSAETLRRTSLKQMRRGTRVNLERPLSPTTRFGGHIVQGHVDGTGEFLQARPEGNGQVVRVGFPAELARYIVEKGSITVDGISLTVASLAGDWFEIAVIPHTWQVTNLSELRRGDQVNLEIDIIARYIERMLDPHLGGNKSQLTLDQLKELGY